MAIEIDDVPLAQDVLAAGNRFDFHSGAAWIDLCGRDRLSLSHLLHGRHACEKSRGSAGGTKRR